ncbi:MAG: hypothetical protein LBC92_01730 [Rickettsiales bacterium]|jgi:hypothetical protein|nr:hypothetical protein [Rickettsiales bacterium]
MGRDEDEEAMYIAERELGTNKYGDGSDLPAISEGENFLPRSDGFVYGFMETKAKHNALQKQREGASNSKSVKNINIERIDWKYAGRPQIDNCLVIFVTLGSGNIVGYYKDATIYRERQMHGKLVKTDGYYILYSFKTKKENAILLERRFPVDIKNGLHYGQSFQKYVNDENRDYVVDILNELLNKIIVPTSPPPKDLSYSANVVNRQADKEFKNSGEYSVEKEIDASANKIMFLNNFQWFERQIVNGKYNKKTIGDFLRDEPYIYKNDDLSKLVRFHEIFIQNIIKTRNFMIHNDAEYKIKDDDFKKWSALIKEMKAKC